MLQVKTTPSPRDPVYDPEFSTLLPFLVELCDPTPLPASFWMPSTQSKDQESNPNTLVRKGNYKWVAGNIRIQNWIRRLDCILIRLYCEHIQIFSILNFGVKTIIMVMLCIGKKKLQGGGRVKIIQTFFLVKKYLHNSNINKREKAIMLWKFFAPLNFSNPRTLVCTLTSVIT